LRPVANAGGWQQRGNGATVSKLPLERTGAPGIYRRGSKYVVVYRVEGRQRKQYAGTLAEARAIELERDGEARALRRGPTLQGFSLSWLDPPPTACARTRAASTVACWSPSR
jgi:hypothetical protein